MLSNVSSASFMSGRLAPSTARPTGMPWLSTSRLRLAPFLARSVGFLPVFFPPEGRLGHAPVQRQPLPIDALHTVVLQQPGLPHLPEDAGLNPLLKAVMSRGPRTEDGRIESLPGAARAQHIEDGIHADAVRSPRL